MKKFYSCVFFVFLNLTLFAQEVFLPLISLHNIDGDENSLYISDVTTDVKIVGNIVVTSIDFFLNNNATRSLEGDVEFALNDGQAVVEYSLDIDGKLRKSVVVEKEKGRKVFEDIVRKDVDPGLLEVTEGNNFKIRVYPIFPNSNRHVQFVYQQEVKDTYILNPLTEKTLNKYTFNMTVCKPSNYKTSSTDSSSLNDSYNMHIEKTDYSFNEPFVINLPSDSKFIGVFTQTSGADTYFYYSDILNPVTRPKSKSNSVGILFDVSGSAAKRNIEKEIEFLKAYLNKNTIGRTKIKVVLFRNEICGSKEFTINQIDEVESYLKNQVFDGGTAIASIDFDKEFSLFDEILLFTDGLNNWGKSDVEKSKIPVNVITSSVSADFAYMKKIAQDSKGSYVNLVNSNQEQALSLLCNQPYRIVDIKYSNDEIQEIYPSVGAEVDENFSLCGILKKKSGSVKISFGYGNEVVEEKEFTVSSVDENIEIDNVMRLWAQKKIDELSVNYDKNQAQIIQIAKKYKIVTKDTSLLILDTLEDYIRYEIEPPEELLVGVDKRYFEQMKTRLEEEGVPSDVLLTFEEFKKWYNTKPGNFIKKRGIIQKNHSPSLEYRVLDERAAAASSEVSVDGLRNDDVAFVEWNSEAVILNSNENIDIVESSMENLSKISIMSWNPDAQYISILKKTSVDKMYDEYLKLKKEYEISPSFYMDVADYFWGENLKQEALCILSNLSEIDLDNTDVLRTLGNKLVEWKLYEYAEIVFENLASSRAEIPEFSRDYGLVLAENGKYQKAIEILYGIVLKQWDGRFSEIQQIVLNDMNAIIALHPQEVNTDFIDPKVMENFPVDIRIVLTWNTDNCDIDLWTTDPDNEKCYYNHKLTVLGGHNSRDFIQGYGPEEFCLKTAKKGVYTIEADYYGTNSQKIVQPVVVQAEVYTNFGKPNQKKQILTLRLETVNGSYLVGTIQF